MSDEFVQMAVLWDVVMGFAYIHVMYVMRGIFLKWDHRHRGFHVSMSMNGPHIHDIPGKFGKLTEKSMF